MKYLLVLIVLVVAYNIWRKQQRLDGAAEEQQKQRTAANRANPRTPLIPQEMVPCARCGLILPKSEALQQGDKNYCSADHQRQGPA